MDFRLKFVLYCIGYQLYDYSGFRLFWFQETRYDTRVLKTFIVILTKNLLIKCNGNRPLGQKVYCCMASLVIALYNFSHSNCHNLKKKDNLAIVSFTIAITSYSCKTVRRIEYRAVERLYN